MLNTKKQNNFLKLSLYFSTLLIGLISVFGLAPVLVNATAITESYGTNSPIQEGVIVQLVPNDSTKVEPASTPNIKQIFGVVINGADTTLSLSNNSNAQQVYVVSSGDYQVLVSDQNGPIRSGDYITLSNIDGVGMKADSSQPIIVGQAIQNFNGQGTNISTESIKNSSKGSQLVHIGLISVRISIAQNPLLKTQPTPLPAYLQKFSFYAVGKVVSPLRIYLGLAILIIVLIISVSMIYAAAKNSLISLGRNPLSRKVITKGFLELVLVALIILISGVFGVYLLLKA